MAEAYRLGASLYVPAVNRNLLATLAGQHCLQARSVIACTEDAVAEQDLPLALRALAVALPKLPPRVQGPMRFIRPRNAAVLDELLSMPAIDRVHGFVLPKADTDSLPAYEQRLAGREFWVMPTLETAPVFDVIGQREIRECLQRSALRRQVLALRIGGNDLLRMLSLKRSRGVTLYETPIGLLIQQLLLCFRPFGYQLTAPVYDFVDDPETLVREARADVAMGLVGKTAIHPQQIPWIESALSVSDDDIRAAREVLSPGHAVVRLDGAMIERTVHDAWARAVLAREAAQAAS